MDKHLETTYTGEPLNNSPLSKLWDWVIAGILILLVVLVGLLSLLLPDEEDLHRNVD